MAAETPGFLICPIKYLKKKAADYSPQPSRRVLQNYIKRSTKYLFDYNRRLFKKLQMQGAARLQAEAYSLYVEH
ncbi:MAG: hypothetical protein VR68_01640 [Peptococcaceae bacterium BRH_c4a]|nr:MAG: hypothetical protein VR68_01640 [Peptococcaceae bacterium BRH_c4a]